MDRYKSVLKLLMIGVFTGSCIYQDPAYQSTSSDPILQWPVTIPAVSTISSTPTPSQVVTKPTHQIRPSFTQEETEVFVLPGFIAGTVTLYSDEKVPLKTEIELWGYEKSQLVATLTTQEDGTFTFNYLSPGHYGLWVLLNNYREVPFGCFDIIMEGNQWYAGLIFEDGTYFADNFESSMAWIIWIIENSNSADRPIKGYYMITEINLDAGERINLDVDLLCRR